MQVFTAIGGVVLFCGLMLAQDPVEDIDKALHPNLAGAQHFVVQANYYVALAQKDNDDDMKGHAEKARLLLQEVNHELKAAAIAANEANAARAKQKAQH
jgi:hypothetical protein